MGNTGASAKLTGLSVQGLLNPPSIEEWERLSSRERQLSAIADIIGYWIKWEARKFHDSGMEIVPDSHVWLNGYEGAPPHWPSVGQLTRWLMVLRNQEDGVAYGPSC